ncbi:MAG: hypothetical protein QOD51_228 [Candidatus Eremiobacteraeota bacterium]|jgi:hypothetical protein|nr:hypothetical protein [Candidatus Eremiobacteraeota bacterium]
MSTNVAQRSPLARIATSFSTIADIAVAPKSGAGDKAFSGSIVVALLTLVALAYLGTVLEHPVTEKVIHMAILKQLHDHSTGSGENAAAMGERLTAVYTRIVPIVGLVMLLVQQFVGAGLMSLAVLMLNGRADYRKMLYIFAHTSVLTVGLAQLGAGIIHALQGPAAYDTSLSMMLSIPSAAWLVNASPQAQVIAAAINPFTLWQVAILTLWLAHAARLPVARALVAACVPLVLFTALAAMYANGS